MAVPFAAVLTLLLFRGRRAVQAWLPHSSFAALLAGGLVLLLFTDVNFLRYPGVLSSVLRGAPSTGPSLTEDPVDLSGLPPESAAHWSAFRQTAAAVRTLARDGGGVAVLDIDDTLFYYAAGVAPWYRYSPLFQMILTREALRELSSALRERAPATVVMRDTASPPGFDSVWSPLHELVRSRYTLAQKIGVYEIWRRPVAAPR
jgi:hypothetical protein